MVEQSQLQGLACDLSRGKEIFSSEAGIFSAFEDRHNESFRVDLIQGLAFDRNLHHSDFATSSGFRNDCRKYSIYWNFQNPGNH